MMRTADCRFCGAHLKHTFADLGMSPLCQSQIAPEALERMEPFYPLHAYVCGECFLVQLKDYVAPAEIFEEYAYFSSFSQTWLDHAADYVQMVTKKLSLGSEHLVVEIASNDGYLLQFFKSQGIPVLGVEPAVNVARAAQSKGIETLVKFFGCQTALEMAAAGRSADLIVGNNVLAHVPDINDFVEGLARLLKPQGVLTMEFPHLMALMVGNQFDTIYHEHFSYLSLLAVEKIFEHHGLRLFDVQQLSTHGGSLRIWACHRAAQGFATSKALTELRDGEQAAGLSRLETYSGFEQKMRTTKYRLLELLIDLKLEGKSIAAYGAAGKGNTLLNYCGIRTDFIDFTVDKNPYKQNHYLPGSRIPVFAPEIIRERKPDYLLILPWNLKEEIIEQEAYIREWGGRFIVPIPEAVIYP
jgi:SAM-dependent methyltransferase